MRRTWKLAGCGFVALAIAGLLALAAPRAARAEKAETEYLKNVQTGNPQLVSIGTLNFGPQGLLLVSDPKSAAVIAIRTKDAGPLVKLKQRVANVQALVAAAVGAPAGGAQVVDMAVNPLSGKIYLAVARKADNRPAILTVDADGSLHDFALENVEYVRIAYPAEDRAKVQSITDVEFAGDRVVVAAQSNEEFASKIYSIPLPLTHAATGDMFSTETYHVAHGRWETKAPIQSFFPYAEHGQQFVVGAFACTPIVKFPLTEVQAGSRVKGASVVELGSGNRPLDMFSYEKDGQKWLVTNTYRFHFQKNTFGPSKWWGARVNMSYLGEQNAVNEKAARRNVAERTGPDGIEIVDALFGAVQVAQLDNAEIIVLRAAGPNDSESELALEVAELP